jgi:phosphohistidine phosphatase
MQELLIIRHAIAYERDSKRWPDDDQRPLTDAGAKRFRRLIRRLRPVLPTPEEVLSSPLVRARETARILRRGIKCARTKNCQALRPEARVATLLEELSQHRSQCIAIVGHEPSLSALVAALLGAESLAGKWKMKKGALLWLRFERGIGKGRAAMVAYLPPRIRRLQ